MTAIATHIRIFNNLAIRFGENINIHIYWEYTLSEILEIKYTCNMGPFRFN